MILMMDSNDRNLYYLLYYGPTPESIVELEGLIICKSIETNIPCGMHRSFASVSDRVYHIVTYNKLQHKS